MTSHLPPVVLHRHPHHRWSLEVNGVDVPFLANGLNMRFEHGLVYMTIEMVTDQFAICEHDPEDEQHASTRDVRSPGI